MSGVSHPLWRCFAFYRAVPWLFVTASLAVVLVNLAQPFVQWLIGCALDEVQSGRAVFRGPDGGLDSTRAWWWVMVLVGVTVIRALAQYVSTVFAMVLGQRLLFHLRDQVLNHIQQLDLNYHQRHGAGELINRATRDSDKVRDAVVGGYRTVLELSMVVVGTLGLLAFYSPLLATVPALLILAAVLLARSQADRLVALDRDTDAAYDSVAQDLSEGVHGVRVIKAFGLEDVRIGRFRSRIDGYVAAAGNALAFTAVRLPVPQIIVATGHAWVLLCGAWLVAHQQLQIGELIAAMMAMQAVVFRIEAVGRLVQVFADARASAARIMEMMDAVPAVTSGDKAVIPGVLQLSDVHVVDGRGGREILAGIDVIIRPGEVVALVGITGSGKSTLAALLPRLRDPDAGSVSLGGIDIRELRLAELRRLVQVVYQDSFLFSDSVAANLRVAAPEATEAEIWEVLEQADAKEFVAAMPLQLEAELGERGVTLSGGQRQRLCLARALIARPAVLCGDDATSALDAVTEARILTNLRGRMDKTAVLLIATKLSTILLADRVVMLCDGKITADGTHPTLLANSAYRELLGLDETTA